ncbi:Predicted lipid carrier protein YhbT, contains SCP2 domain [Bradyrhizobium sp. Rc3b]|uniref:ubiquinone anaerobic biosynthesis accessory factor UbiT n=1 Tax=unclassified Bradyrhizobium TaxID=2631580 RepID=UPI0008E8FA41|nr:MULTISPECIES: SCP2 sterol-binding domain-containing protein [unclassified Bradyrhizobium]MBB4377159.1 putative lipid carrier protein YhbT [Bradyrhizobium sp. SBR1B]SFM62176.1 Predicted lipid carrier protein YhbT, contains SCP2 domain [Bradyrhizobium sp. Rc3b]
MNDPSAASPGPLPTIPPLVALAMRPLPLLPLQLALGGVLQRIYRRNPAIFDRLGDHARARFGIKPIDLPFAFVVEARPRLSVVRDLPRGLDARISASLANLLALLEGRVDGDALMFSRELVVEGDVEAVLALRNAIDDAQLDLAEELSSLFGPLGAPARRAFEATRGRVIASSGHGEQSR